MVAGQIRSAGRSGRPTDRQNRRPFFTFESLGVDLEKEFFNQNFSISKSWFDII